MTGKNPNGGQMQAAIEPAPAETRGCGALIGSCGHQGDPDQESVWLSGTCRCGRTFNVRCSSSSCRGRDFYC